jgi:hypothetical protein
MGLSTVARISPEPEPPLGKGPRRRGEIRGQVVCPLHLLPRCTEGLDQTLEHGGITHADPEAPGHRPKQIARLERGGPGEKPPEGLQLQRLRALAGQERDAFERAVDLLDREWRGNGLVVSHQVLGGVAQISPAPSLAKDRRVRGHRGCRHCPERQLLAQPEFHSFPVGPQLALDQVDDLGDDPSGCVGEEARQLGGDLQPGASALDPGVDLGETPVEHRSPCRPS